MIHFLYNFYLTQNELESKNYLYKRLFWLNYKLLKWWLPKYYHKLPNKKECVDNNSDIVVSLTSFPARINVVHLAIKSILNQTTRPYKVVLWLAEEQFPDKENELPENLLKLREHGLEIFFCEDIKPHKKYFFTFQKFKAYRIVTIDDDVIYANRTLELLDKYSKKYPDSIIANRVREIKMNKDELYPYRTWTINPVVKEPSLKLFATGVGGVLYKTSFFSDDFYNIEKLKELAQNDDIWLKAGALKNNVPVVFTRRYFYHFIVVPDSQKESLFASNVFLNDNDRQIHEVFDFFKITKKSLY